MKKSIASIIAVSIIGTSFAGNASEGNVAESMGYMNCYALQPSQKQKCQQKISKSVTKEYIYEAERLGFAEFLRKHKQPCNSISNGVLFNEQKQAYKAICDDKNSYFLRFNYKNNSWEIEE